MEPKENQSVQSGSDAAETLSNQSVPAPVSQPEPTAATTPATVAPAEPLAPTTDPAITSPSGHTMMTNPAAGATEEEESTGVETANLHPEAVVIKPLSSPATAGEKVIAPLSASEMPAPSDTTPSPELITPAVPPAAASAPAVEESNPITTPSIDTLPPAAYTGTGAVMSGGIDEPKPPRFNKKKLLVIGGSVVLLLGIVSGVVFGWYLPNTPGAVWKTGINRSGKAIDSLVVSATEPKKLESYKTSKISGSVNAKVADQTFSGDFDTTFDKTSLDGGLSFTMNSNGSKKQTISAMVMSEIPSSSAYPNIYFIVSGFKDLGLDSFVPGINAYDGKWIFVSSDYLKSTGANVLGSGGDNTKQVTSADIAEIARVSSSVTKDYVFNTAEDKAVFEQQSFEGKEKVDGISAYHYKANINTDHAKAYCIALSHAVLETDAYKKLSGQTDSQISDEKKKSSSDCANTVKDSFKQTDTFDVWVDGKYKLIHKVRVYNRAEKGVYTEIGQTYKGGDELALFANYHDTKGKNDSKATLDVNLKTNSTKGNFEFTGTDADNPYRVTANFNASVSDAPVKITKPATSTPLSDVLKKLGLDDLVPATGASTSATPLRQN